MNIVVKTLLASILLANGYLVCIHSCPSPEEVKRELDAIFSPPEAQKILEREKSFLATARYLVAQAERISKLRKIVPQGNAEKPGKGFGNALLIF